MTLEEEWDPNIVEKENAMYEWEKEARLQELLDSIKKEDMPEIVDEDLTDEKLNYRLKDKKNLFIDRLNDVGTYVDTDVDTDVFEDE